jgi:hypothetical protein
VIEGRDVIPIPMSYYSEFFRDPTDSLLKYGSTAQRARAPWFTNVRSIEECLVLPDLVCGPMSEQPSPDFHYRSLIGARDEHTMLGGISEHFRSNDDGYWHVHVDLALNKKRHGDAAGIALGRIVDSYEERSEDPAAGEYVRIVNSYEVPLVAQIIAPVGEQIYLGSVVRFILQLKQLRGFNITSFSSDTFASADVGQQLMHAEMVTVGMDVDEWTGEIHGMPKPFSVDRTAAPYRELLEVVNERRVLLPRYQALDLEMRRLECGERRGDAPDHPQGGSKDVADPVAGVVGYLSAFGHAELAPAEDIIVTREDLTRMYDIPDVPDFAVEDAGIDFSVGDADEGLMVGGDSFGGFDA